MAPPQPHRRGSCVCYTRLCGLKGLARDVEVMISAREVPCARCLLCGVPRLNTIKFLCTADAHDGFGLVCYIVPVSVAQWITRLPTEQKIGGSNPPGNSNGSFFQQCGAVEACWAHNPEVVGSKPTTAITFCSTST